MSVRTSDHRLRKSSEFARVYKEGARAACAQMAVYIRPNGLGRRRFGFSVSKKVGNAVVRNKVRRRLKEIVRREIDWGKVPCAGGKVLSLLDYDMVISARQAITAAGYAALSRELMRLMGKAAARYEMGSRGAKRLKN